MKSWALYGERDGASSAIGPSLVSAFAKIVQIRTDFAAHEIPAIMAAPADDGENDACRDLVFVLAEGLATQFVLGHIATYARPLGGGEAVRMKAELWELDHPAWRFATGMLNLERWADAAAEPTHRIFVDRDQFDQYLAFLPTSTVLTDDQVARVVDPALHARRSRQRSLAPTQVRGGPVLMHQQQEHAASAVGAALVDIEQVMLLTGLKRTSVYKLIKAGSLPEPVKIGSRSLWPADEIHSWVQSRMAERL